MTKLPVITYRQFQKVAELCGYRWIRRKGSHNIFQNSNGQTLVVPDHGSEVIVRPLLRSLLREIGLTIDDYLKILNKL